MAEDIAYRTEVTQEEIPAKSAPNIAMHLLSFSTNLIIVSNVS
jgi:hypothetical protein